MWRDWLFRVRALLGRKTMDADLDRELRDHLAHQTTWHEHRGLPAGAATRQASVDLNGVEALKEQCRDERGTRWLEDLSRDAIYTVRILRRSPGFAAVAIVSLALGLGANTVAFSLAHALVLRPLPVRAPGEIVFVQGGRDRPTMSVPNYRDLRDQTTTLAGLAAYRFSTVGLARGGSSDRVWGYLVTGNYFGLLGVAPALGRVFTAADDGTPGSNRVAILSYATWRDRFSGDRSIIGKSIQVNAGPYTVVGVLPEEFRGTERFFTPDIWLPMSAEPDIEGFSWLDSRAAFNACVIGRLRPGVTPAQASADLNGIAGRLATEYPDDDAGMEVVLARPGWLGDSLGAPVDGFTRGIIALAALVLFAACANLASLLLARTADRRRELGIRLAVGAGRSRIARQLIVEAMALAAAGGIAGVALATFLLRALSHWHAPLQLPVELDVTPDWSVVAFAAAVTVATGLLFGLAPAQQAWRTDLTGAWKGTATARVGRRRWTARDVLVVTQIALCSVLVLASFVAGRGLSRAVDAPVGFESKDLSVVGFDLRLARYDMARGRIFQRQILDAVRGLPGVTGVAYADTLPLNIDQSFMTVFPEHPATSGPDAGTNANSFKVSPDFSHDEDADDCRPRLHVERHGRGATGGDRQSDVRARRARVGQPDRRALSLGRGGTPVEVVGLVEDGKYVSLVESSKPAVFRPAPALYSGVHAHCRAHGARPRPDRRRHREAGRARRDRGAPIYTAGTEMDMLALAFFPGPCGHRRARRVRHARAHARLTGTYGVASYAVSKRTREIGIRVAIGARPAQVVRAMLGRVAMAARRPARRPASRLGMLGRPILGAVVYEATSADPLLLVSARSPRWRRSGFSPRGCPRAARFAWTR